MRLFAHRVPSYHVCQSDIDQGAGERFHVRWTRPHRQFEQADSLAGGHFGALLAVSEMGGKSSQTNGLSSHIDASNLWSFFQAKTIRQTTLRTAADKAEATFKDTPQGMPAAMKAQAERWRQTAQRYETEPETGEGRKELVARAKTKEEHRDKSLAAYHMFEYASAGFQLAIVLAGAAALTSVTWLTFISMGLGVVGVGFTLLAFLAPTSRSSLTKSRSLGSKKTPGGSCRRASLKICSRGLIQRRRPPVAGVNSGTSGCSSAAGSSSAGGGRPF